MAYQQPVQLLTYYILLSSVCTYLQCYIFVSIGTWQLKFWQYTTAKPYYQKKMVQLETGMPQVRQLYQHVTTFETNVSSPLNQVKHIFHNIQLKSFDYTAKTGNWFKEGYSHRTAADSMYQSLMVFIDVRQADLFQKSMLTLNNKTNSRQLLQPNQPIATTEVTTKADFSLAE